MGADVGHDFRWSPVSWCGFEGVHKGFTEALRLFTQGFKFRSFQEYLQNPGNCPPHRTYVTGHSMGGAMAALLYACANQHEHNYAQRHFAEYQFGLDDIHLFVEGISETSYWSAPNVPFVEPKSSGSLKPGALNVGAVRSIQEKGLYDCTDQDCINCIVGSSSEKLKWMSVEDKNGRMNGWLPEY